MWCGDGVEHVPHACTLPAAQFLTRDRLYPLQARYVVHEAAALLPAGTPRVHFVSRLDRGTSGVLAGALSTHAARALQAVWAHPAVVTKEYVVLVVARQVAAHVQPHMLRCECALTSFSWRRHPTADSWTDTRPLMPRAFGGGVKGAPRSRDAEEDDEDCSDARQPQPARTDFHVLARFPPQPGALPFHCALLLASLHSGRWHQIRRHLSHAGLHVLGDTSHGKLRYNAPARAALGLHRLFLHASRLVVDLSAPAATAAGLLLPARGAQALRVVAPLPDELAQAAARLPGWAAAQDELRAHGLLP
jgi:23S rRNA-/tRNA-specific pseudouridylate synthase